jgi:hypothetical protein
MNAMKPDYELIQRSDCYRNKQGINVNQQFPELSIVIQEHNSSITFITPQPEMQKCFLCYRFYIPH